MILTAQVPNHRQDHWGHHLISSLRAQAIGNNLTRDRGIIAVVSEIGIWFPDFGSKNYLSILPIVVTNWAICTACKFQECFRMIHVATPETVFWRGRTTTYISVGQSLSRQAATATTNAFFPSIDRIIHGIECLYPIDFWETCIRERTHKTLLKINIWKLFLPLVPFYEEAGFHKQSNQKQSTEEWTCIFSRTSLADW